MDLSLRTRGAGVEMAPLGPISVGSARPDAPAGRRMAASSQLDVALPRLRGWAGYQSLPCLTIEPPGRTPPTEVGPRSGRIEARTAIGEDFDVSI